MTSSIAGWRPPTSKHPRPDPERRARTGVQRPRVVFWNHSPTPYFVERLNAVHDLGTLDLEAWFNDRREPDRSWDVDESSWRFRARYIPRRSMFGWSERIPIPELRESKPDLLVQEYDRAHLIAGFACGSAYAKRTAFRVLPNYDSWSRRTWWRELGKQIAFRAVDGAKVPGEDGRRLATRYGSPAPRTHVVTQSIDVAHYGRARSLDTRARTLGRAQLGLEGCVFIYVGRLWNGKGLDDLLAAYGAISGAETSSLLIVGDGVEEARYRALAASLPRVTFAGFVQPAELPDLYALADVLVFPTLGDPNGLVVEEAMAAGLAVISTSAAGDIRSRVPAGHAGLVVEPGRPAMLADAMTKLACSPELRAQFARSAAELAEQRSHERYAEDFERFAFAVLATERRRTAASAACRVAGALLGFAGRGWQPVPPMTGANSAHDRTGRAGRLASV